MDVDQNGFLNVDLDITCSKDLELLVEALASTMLLLVRDREFASLEVNEQIGDPSETILRIVEIVEALPAPIQPIWNGTERRALNVGVDAGPKGAQRVFTISPAAVARAAQINAAIEFTVYSHDA